MTPRPATLPHSFFFYLSLLGHKSMDLVRGLRDNDVAALPLLRFAFIGTVALAGLQFVGAEPTITSGPSAPSVAQASLFGGSTEAVANFTAADLQAIEAYRRQVAQVSLRLDLDRTVLLAAAVLSDRQDATGVDVAAFATDLKGIATERHAITRAEWTAAAAELFPDAIQARADLRYLVRRYAL